MVTRQRAPKTRRDRSSALNASGDRGSRFGRKAHSSEHVYGMPVPERLHELIEIERDNLSKAESLLACMVVSMEYETDPLSGPYYPAVAQIARELVERSINGLDPLILQQRLRRNKIEEECCRSFVDRTYFLVHQEFKAGAHPLAA